MKYTHCRKGRTITDLATGEVTVYPSINAAKHAVRLNGAVGVRNRWLVTVRG